MPGRLATPEAGGAAAKESQRLVSRRLLSSLVALAGEERTENGVIDSEAEVCSQWRGGGRCV